MRGNGVGWALASIVLWGTLAAAAGDALQGVRATTLVPWCFLFAAPTLLLYDLGVRRRSLAQSVLAPPRMVALGLLGILGYHALLFEAIERAPIVEANLVNYLWPLLIVVLAPLITRERVSPLVFLGSVVGFAGAAVVVTKGRAPELSAEHALGYSMALGAAFAWSTFSLLLKRTGTGGAGRMTAFTVWSFAAALAIAALRGGLDVPPPRALAAIAWVGVGPMALAFICWDLAMARGRASTIGALSYLDPLLSTLCVAWALREPLTLSTWVGMGLIVTGAAVAPLLARPVPANAKKVSARPLDGG